MQYTAHKIAVDLKKCLTARRSNPKLWQLVHSLHAEQQRFSADYKQLVSLYRKSGPQALFESPD